MATTTETEDVVAVGGLALLGYLLWRHFNAAAPAAGTPGESALAKAWDAINAAGSSVVSAVEGAIHAGTTSAIAQGATISVTGGDPTLQGSAVYTDPSQVPNVKVQQAWNDFVAQVRAAAASAPTNDAALGRASQVYQTIRQYAPYFVSVAAAAGYPVGIGAAASSQLGIGGILGGGAAGVLAADAGLFAYGIGSLIESFQNGYASTPAQNALAVQTATAILTGDQQLAQDAQAVYDGTATSDQAAYVQAHAMSSTQLLTLTTSAKLAAGEGSKQLWDPLAPGGYIDIGGSYGVKQAQTAAQNKAEAQAQGTTIGGSYHAGNTETGVANQ